MLSNTNFTTGLVAESGSLAVTALSGGQIHLLEPLGLRSGRDGPKLQGLEVELTSAGDPWFPGGAGAMRCEVVESMDFGDSTGFLCAVRERWPGRDEAMRWADARAQVGAEFLAAWAEKSAREQATARQAMKWVD